MDSRQKERHPGSMEAGGIRRSRQRWMGYACAATHVENVQDRGVFAPACAVGRAVPSDVGRRVLWSDFSGPYGALARRVRPSARPSARTSS